MAKINLVYHFGFDNLIATYWKNKKNIDEVNNDNKCVKSS